MNWLLIIFTGVWGLAVSAVPSSGTALLKIGRQLVDGLRPTSGKIAPRHAVTARLKTLLG